MKKEFKVRDLRRKEKFFVDDEYLNGWAKKLKPNGTAVYLSLCRHADKEQSCFPSMDLIAKQHSISRKTVQRAINKLRDYNIIRSEQERNKTGKFYRNIYFLLDKKEWKSAVGQKRPTASRGSKKTITEGLYRPTVEPITEGQSRPNKVTQSIKVTQRKVTQQKKYSSLSELGAEEFLEIAEKYHVSFGFVKLQHEKMCNWLEAKGKRYKNYKRALMNWVLGDIQKQVERRADDKYRPVDARNID
jgi:predicted transcriptional regulator